MNSLYDFDDIDDYVQGRMSDADRAAFETALSADAELAKRVEALRAESVVLGGLRREGLLEKLTEWEEEMPLKPGIVPLWRRPWIQAAAAAVAAILLIWTLWPGFQTKPADTGIAERPGIQDSSDKTASNDSKDSLTEGTDKIISPPQKQMPLEPPYAEMAIKNFNADYSSINLMGESAQQKEQNPLLLAAGAIAQKQYETALAHLRKIPATNADDFTAAQIMAGDVYFFQKKFALAWIAYAEPAKSEKDKFRDLAQWRLLLASLALYPQKRADFERIMTAILADPDHPYFESAKKVQSEIKKD